MLLILFWLAFFLIVYTYAGYPVLISLAARFSPKKINKKEKCPSVSILIAAYNEARNIGGKIDTCRQLDYPQDKLEILIGSDASDDGTDRLVLESEAPNVKLVRMPERVGKVTVLNELVKRAQGELLFFTDARQVLEPRSLKKLVANFADDSVGSVSGELMLTGKVDGSYGEGVGFYWQYEKMIRKAESRFNSMLGATGAIYVLRKELFVPAPADTLLDDMYYPLQAVAQGYRAVFEEEAKAFDRVSLSPAAEMRRKVRTLAGNFQILEQLPGLFNPTQSSIAWQLISHKLLRVLVPYFLILIFGVNYYLTGPFYRAFFFAQSIFYLFALVGSLVKNTGVNSRLFSLPLTFCTLNIAALLGGFSYFSGRQKAIWKK